MMFLIAMAPFLECSKKKKKLYFTKVYYVSFLLRKLGARLSVQRKPLSYILVIVVTIFLLPSIYSQFCILMVLYH